MVKSRPASGLCLNVLGARRTKMSTLFGAFEDFILSREAPGPYKYGQASSVRLEIELPHIASRDEHDALCDVRHTVTNALQVVCAPQ